MNETVCHCHCLLLSEGMVVSMAATSWQQCANDDEDCSQSPGWVQQEFSELLPGGRGGSEESTGGDSEVDLNPSYRLYHNKEIQS